MRATNAATATQIIAGDDVVAARNAALAPVSASTNSTLARRRFNVSRPDTRRRAARSAWLRLRGAVSYARTGSGRRRRSARAPLRRAGAALCDRADTPGRPAAAGRLSGEGASGRAIERMATPRAGTARCRLDNWLRKSDTEEFGRFSIRERSKGGTRTAAHAAATTSRTS